MAEHLTRGDLDDMVEGDPLELRDFAWAEIQRLQRLLANLATPTPPGAFPHVLTSADDVRAVCEHAGLIPDIRTNPVFTWSSADAEVHLSHLSHRSGAVFVKRRKRGRRDSARMATVYVGAPSSLLLAAIRAAEEGHRG